MPVRFAALLLPILLSACTHYRYTDPQTPEGLNCLHTLDAEVNACETKIKAQQDNFDGLHDFQMRNTQQCEHFNSLDIPNACPPPPPVTKVSNYCRSGYADKFVACGGSIEKVEE